MKVLIIGGGPAGMIAGISSARDKENSVAIYEKMESLGKKILVTGKGRCNITNAADMSEFISNVPGNGRFLYSAFENFTNKDIIELLEKNGVKTKVERGNRVFPVSDRAIDVRNALEREVKKLGIKYPLEGVPPMDKDKIKCLYKILRED